MTPPVIRVYDVVDGGTKLANGRTFITAEPGGIPDGLRVDVDGNLWCGWGGGEGHDGVMIFNSSGAPIGRIDLPERCANLCFGGLKRNRLFMTACRSLYSLYVGVEGCTRRMIAGRRDCPPLQLITCPVMKLASSEARNAMAAACSSSRPRRRSACWFVMSCAISWAVSVGAGLVSFIRRDAGPDELSGGDTVVDIRTAGRHRVDPYAVAAIFHGQNLA